MCQHVLSIHSFFCTAFIFLTSFLFCNTIAQIMLRKRVVIVGAGPAGIACSIQLKRFGIDPFLVERDEPGGLLRQAHLVENYPGFPSGIPGGTLVQQFLHHLGACEIPVHTMDVTALKLHGDHFSLSTDREEIDAEVVVVAAGTEPKPLGTSYADMNGSVLYDVRTLRSLHNRRIAIIGGGDTAFDYAIALSAMNEVSIFFRRPKPSCLPILRERTEESSSVHLCANCNVKHILKKGVKYVIDCNRSEQDGGTFDHVLCAIGRIPSIQFLSGALRTAFEQGEDLPNLYFIGDVHNGKNRQTAIAVGDGIQAAMQICRVHGAW
jgi:thioredoxin reductase